MVARIIDPDRFILSAAVIDWRVISRRRLDGGAADEQARQRKISTRVVQLRWLIDPEFGYPTEPFKVWRRPSLPMEGERPVEFETYPSFPSIRVYVWTRPLVYIRAQIKVSGTNAAVIAYAGAPFGSAVSDWRTLTTGTRTVTLSGVGITCLVIYGDAELQDLSGLTGRDAAADGSWQPIEDVGLPVDQGAWAGIQNLDAMQGLLPTLTDPISAALDRFRRGAPLYGWNGQIEPGRPAPAWSLADPKAIIKAFEADLSKPLMEMVKQFPPENHHLYGESHTMEINGSATHTADTRYVPISMLLLGASSDPLISLITGFGTAFDDEDIPGIDLADRSLFKDPSRSDWDYMVTAHYRNGLDGASPPVEYAAIVRAPGFAMAPPKPANLAARSDGLTPPQLRDQPYRGVVRLAWDKIPDKTPFRVASFAAARTAIAPTSAVVSLMGTRKYDPLVAQPISATTSPDNEQATGTLRSLDESYAIAPANSPNIVRYSIAHQSLFGLWSDWSSVGHTLQEPPVQSARILSARLDVDPAATPVCPATLVIDFTWDWAVRSPERIEILGKLYAASRPGAAPASLALPSGFQKSFPGPSGSPLSVSFSGSDAGTAGGAVLAYLSEDGQTILAGPSTYEGPRRYRLTVPGFSLDYASTGHIGIALWVRGQEHIAPQRVGPWSVEPKIATASDPRPPVITMMSEDVELASLADGRGEHRVKLDWPAIAGAAGYFVYETTELKFRTDLGMGEAMRSQTLSERLLALRNKFHELSGTPTVHAGEQDAD